MGLALATGVLLAASGCGNGAESDGGPTRAPAAQDLACEESEQRGVDLDIPALCVRLR